MGELKTNDFIVDAEKSFPLASVCLRVCVCLHVCVCVCVHAW